MPGHGDDFKSKDRRGKCKGCSSGNGTMLLFLLACLTCRCRPEGFRSQHKEHRVHGPYTTGLEPTVKSWQMLLSCVLCNRAGCATVEAAFCTSAMGTGSVPFVACCSFKSIVLVLISRYAPRPEDEVLPPPPIHSKARIRPSDGEEEDDDVWAERIWRDMEEHKRQMQKQRVPQRGLGFGDGAGSVRQEAAAKRAKRAAEAKAESDRVLREEHAKDADWREAMLRQVQEVREWGCKKG